MCWLCWKPRKRIARTNIHVFKLVYYNKERDIISSAYVCFKYQLNQLYVTNNKIEFKTTEHGNKYITEGVFHSYKYSRVLYRITTRLFSKNKALLLYTKNTFPMARNQTNIIDGYDIILTYSSDFKLYVMKCIIPIGTTYYLNAMGCYISNAIKPYQLIDVETYDKLSEHYRRK